MKYILLLLTLTHLFALPCLADIQVQGYLNNAAMENLASDPTCAPASTCPLGRMYWNTVSNEPRIWDGALWQELLAGSASVPDPLLLGNGTAGAPTYSFTSDPTTGMYRVGAGDIGFTTANAIRLTLSDDATFPATFERAGQNRLRILSNPGNAILRIQAAGGGVSEDSVIEFGDLADAVAGRIFYDHSADDFLHYIGANVVNVLSGGPGVSTDFALRNDGTNTLTSNLYFDDAGSSNEGGILYSHVSDNMVFRTAGSTRLTVGSVVTPAVHVRNIAGTTGAPAYSFAGDTGTGIHNPSFGTLTVSTNSSDQVVIDTNGAYIVDGTGSGQSSTTHRVKWFMYTSTSTGTGNRSITVTGATAIVGATGSYRAVGTNCGGGGDTRTFVGIMASYNDIITEANKTLIYFYENSVSLGPAAPDPGAPTVEPTLVRFHVKNGTESNYSCDSTWSSLQVKIIVYYI